MFGYILANQKGLAIDEQQIYRSYYCGLCHTLAKNHGLPGQITLNYDLTFVYLLLSSLYETTEQKSSGRCLIHPVKAHNYIETAIAEYAADMNVLLSYYNLKDDWADEKNILSKTESDLLKKHFKDIEKKYPKQAEAAKQYVMALSKVEQADKQKVEQTDFLNSVQKAGAAISWSDNGNRGTVKNNDHNTSSDLNSIPEQKEDIAGNRLDLAGGLTGILMGEILLYRRDEWEKDLLELGFYLGKFIYLMDAFEDIEKDTKKKMFNPWIEYLGRKDFDIFAKQVLTDTMAECAKAFERMPILENAGILRNILYSGVWTRYELISQKRNRKGGK